MILRKDWAVPVRESVENDLISFASGSNQESINQTWFMRGSNLSPAVLAPAIFKFILCNGRPGAHWN